MWNSTSSSRPRTSRGRSELGVALPGVLVLAAFLVGVTGWLIGHLRTDTAMTLAIEDTHSGGRVAEAALQIVALALGAGHRLDGRRWPVTCPGVSTGVCRACGPGRGRRARVAAGRHGCQQPLGPRHAQMAATLGLPRAGGARALADTRSGSIGRRVGGGRPGGRWSASPQREPAPPAGCRGSRRRRGARSGQCRHHPVWAGSAGDPRGVANRLWLLSSTCGRFGQSFGGRLSVATGATVG